MKKIEKIDRNFRILSTVCEKDLQFYDVRQANINIYGLYHPTEEPNFCRLPNDVAQKTSEAVSILAYNTSGGRLRFTTDSSYIAIRAIQPDKCLMSHMPFSGSSGFDLYVRENDQYHYGGSLIPSVDRKDGYESIIHFDDRRLRDITINFPLYDCVSELYIGIQSDAILQKSPSYTYSKPIVYYGSSITQGGCASRPGNSYPAIISRLLDCDFINLGFSGGAHGEKEIVDYISSLDMSVLVLDYDHNVSSPEELDETYRPLYHTIRAAHPNLPIIAATRTDTPLNNEARTFMEENRKVICNIYEAAVNSGDRNIYFIDGQQIFPIFGGDSCTVDGVHPSDLGFMCMAKVFYDVIHKILAD